MSKRNRHKRRQATEPPMLVERLQRHDQGHEDFPRLSYEEAKWPYLSPRRREAHNRLRQARGLPTIPPPAVRRKGFFRERSDKPPGPRPPAD